MLDFRTVSIVATWDYMGLGSYRFDCFACICMLPGWLFLGILPRLEVGIDAV